MQKQTHSIQMHTHIHKLQRHTHKQNTLTRIIHRQRHLISWMLVGKWPFSNLCRMSSAAWLTLAAHLASTKALIRSPSLFGNLTINTHMWTRFWNVNPRSNIWLIIMSLMELVCHFILPLCCSSASWYSKSWLNCKDAAGCGGYWCWSGG